MSNVTITINQELLEDCAIALRYKAQQEAGMSQAPDLFEAEDTLEWSQALQIDALLQHAKMRKNVEKISAQLGAFRERSAVLAFQQRFNIPMAQEPAWLPEALFRFRYMFLQEELHEFYVAYLELDMKGAADALVDLCYMIHGTALMMGLPWPVLWEEVHRKNMQKVRAGSSKESKRHSSYDIIKPEGWTPPDHSAALGKGPWPVLKIEE